jgi:hypothetical protein
MAPPEPAELDKKVMFAIINVTIGQLEIAIAPPEILAAEF